MRYGWRRIGPDHKHWGLFDMQHHLTPACGFITYYPEDVWVWSVHAELGKTDNVGEAMEAVERELGLLNEG